MTDTTDTRETLYITDAELIRRMGVPEKIARAKLRVLDFESPGNGFPQRDALWGNRHYWPAVKAWLDRGADTKPQEEKTARPAIGNVYFLATDTFVKIGFTTKPKRRFGQLRNAQPHDLRLALLLTKVPRSLEYALHRRFKQYRVAGKREWFTASPEIEEFILRTKQDSFGHWRKELIG